MFGTSELAMQIGHDDMLVSQIAQAYPDRVEVRGRGRPISRHSC